MNFLVSAILHIKMQFLRLAKISIILIMLFVVCDKAFSTEDNLEQKIDFNVIGSSDIINIADEYSIIHMGEQFCMKNKKLIK